jgi:hypothetical protein
MASRKSTESRLTALVARVSVPDKHGRKAARHHGCALVSRLTSVTESPAGSGPSVGGWERTRSLSKVVAG